MPRSLSEFLFRYLFDQTLYTVGLFRKCQFFILGRTGYVPLESILREKLINIWQQNSNQMGVHRMKCDMTNKKFVLISH